MSEKHPESAPSLAAAGPEDIRLAARQVKTNDERLMAARQAMQQDHPVLLHLLAADFEGLMETSRAEGLSYVKGMLSGYQLLSGVADLQGARLPSEIMVGDDVVANAAASYGNDERVRTEDRAADPFERLAQAGGDVFTAFSRYREFEGLHPAYAEQGVRLAAKSVVRPAHYFQEFLTSGTLGPYTQDFLVIGALSESTAIREHKLFFEYINGYTNVMGNLLLLEDKTRFMQQFSDTD